MRLWHIPSDKVYPQYFILTYYIEAYFFAAVGKLGTQRISYIQEDLTEKCSSILLGYRRNCAASTAPSQVLFFALPSNIWL